VTYVSREPRTGTNTPGRRRAPGRPHANSRLTALTGTLLLVLFAVQGFTVLFIGRLVIVHVFVGLVLIGPVCLKIASTGYRFLNYYGGSPEYRRAGRPAGWLRALGPLVVLTTVALLVSGGALGFLGTTWGPLPLLLVHQTVFWCWITVTALHVLARVLRLPALVGADLGQRSVPRQPAAPGRSTRWLVVFGTLGAGVLIALFCTPLATNWVR
jgi:hypothetical protein